jgi:tRNA(Ile2) C34 agmatinyltransferase TiaS
MWEIEYPIEQYLGSISLKFSLENIEINKLTKCPECNTELEQSMCFFGGYNWKCVKCGFKHKTKENVYTDAERVKRL